MFDEHLLKNRPALELVTFNRRDMSKTFYGFMLVYMSHYLTMLPADFHKELISLLEDDLIKFLSVTGFRGSAKSSILLGYLIWCALEKKHFFILAVNETDDVAKLTIANIREELENNKFILEDYGDAINRTATSKYSKFSETNLLLTNGVRIMSRSRGQKIRGLRHIQHRPSLVLMDDVEERIKVSKKDYRDKTEAWLRSDIIPAIDEKIGRLIMLGNLLHNDAIMSRIKKFENFLCKDYPLFTEGELWENCTWKGKYADQNALDNQQKNVGRSSWLREYCLKVIAEDDQEVKEEWIQYYDELPSYITKSGVGVDLAISKAQTADYTAMVSAVATIDQGRPKIYILPNPIKRKLSFYETIQQMQSLSMTMQLYCSPTFYVENVAYQKAAIEEAKRQMLMVKEVRPGADKRARLRAAATFIQNATVVFPRKGCEDLLDQLIYFGVQEHEDLVDAWVYLILGLSSDGLQEFKVISLT